MNRYKYNYTKEEIKNTNSEPLVDVPVLILFFNRPKQLEKVFAQVRKAKPSTVLLYQDGKRADKVSDANNIQECRNVIDRIDWNCTVFKMYQDQNYGCDPSGFMSRQWAFSLVDRCIVLEDDVVPSVSFFRFCKEMLDRYEDDKRIYRISGQNILGEYQPYNGDYFFTKGGSIWGWATWKRVFDEWDTEYAFLKDEKVVECLQYTYKENGIPIDKFIKRCNWHKKSGKEYFESIYSSARMLGSGLTIVPRFNMISNIGITDDATHGAADIRLLSRQSQKVFNATTYDFDFPLFHPKYILEDRKYDILQSEFMGWKSSFIKKVASKIEEKIRHLMYG